MKGGRVTDPIQRALLAARERAAESKQKAAQTPRGERTDVPPDMGDLWGDVAKSASTGLGGVAESTLGTLGDVDVGRDDLTELINDYFKDKSGLDMAPDLAKVRESRLRAFPTTEQVEAFDDRQISGLSPEARQLMMKWFRHTPETPFGQAAQFGAGFVDPLDMMLPAVSGLGLLRKAL